MDNLSRFIDAQKDTYTEALAEVINGFKRGHWMWYIFPQLKGLGDSPMSEYYGISSLDEACDYLKNEYLRNNLIEITKALLKHNNKDVLTIFGFPDNLKLQSCMTLFSIADPSIGEFKEVLDKYYNGQRDNKTLEMLHIKVK